MNWLDKYQDGGVIKAQRGMHVKEHSELTPINFEGISKAIRNVESLDGKLMMNPSSTATGLFGQRFSEIKDVYPGTREEFAKDTTAQKKFFKDRFDKGLKASKTTPLRKDANDLYKEYSPQFDNFDYSKEDIAVLSNFLGRKGTRKYLGEHVRDEKPLEEVFPNLYGENVKQANKTPGEYLKKAREYYKEGGVIEDDRGQWAHPGKVTKINSNNITMKNVNYPVLGVSNTGDEQMMMPGEDYKFDGDSVTEYPMAQDGGWLGKYNK